MLGFISIFVFFVGGTWVSVWIFVSFFFGWGEVFFLNNIFFVVGVGFLNSFLNFFSVLWWKFIIFCSTFTHSFTQFFFMFWGSAGQCAFFGFGQREAAE